MKLSVVLPVHNEEAGILRVVVELEGSLQAHGISHEIILIDDNSPDASAEILEQLADSSEHI